VPPHSSCTFPGVRRALPLAAASFLLSTCQEAGTSPGPALASLSVVTQLPPLGANFAGTGLEITQVTVRLIRPPSAVVLSQTFPFSVETSSLQATLQLVVSGQETFTLQVDFRNAAGRVLFTSTSSVTLSPGSTAQAPPAPPVYLGPGSNVDSIAVTPVVPQVAANDSLGFSVLAFDGQRQPVPPESVYVRWRTSNPGIGMNAAGLLRAPASATSFWVVARVPVPAPRDSLLDSTFVTVTPAGTQLLLAPDSVEKLPGGTQQFAVTSGPPGPYEWLVSGVVGGNVTVGSIDSTGFYTAPRAVPNPPKVQVCARVTANPSVTGCAVVVINPVPSAGADVVVFNDINIWDDAAFPLDSVDNDRLIRNLVTFTGPGPRANGNTVLFHIGHGSVCSFTCSAQTNTIMAAIIRSTGMVPVEDTSSTFTTAFAPNVKVLLLWTPMVAFTNAEINLMKLFAGEGGRIVFIGEHQGYYGSGIAVENAFLLGMGALMTNIGQSVDCGRVVQPASSLRQHQITAGMNGVSMGCASVITLGPNDFALWYDMTNTQVLAGVAKVDLTPLPAPPAPIRAAAATAVSPPNDPDGTGLVPR
jgi:hypothetical protein